jgi:hypothetical protein
MAPGKHVINVKSTGSSGGMIDNTTEITVQRR